MSDKKFYEDSSFWSGVGLWYVLHWIFTFYPSFIISFTLQRFFFGVSGTESAFLGVEGSGGAYVFSIVVMIIGTFVILGLIRLEQYFIVVMLYLLTAWPFLYILNHLWSCESGQEYPLPLDWWPLW